jgi:hypothetical protein
MANSHNTFQFVACCGGAKKLQEMTYGQIKPRLCPRPLTTWSPT